MSHFVVAALYKFVSLPDYASLKAPLQACCNTHAVKGTLLLAQEGINGTIAGTRAGIDAVLHHLHTDPRFADLSHKESYATTMPFERMKVRLKREIVTLGVPGVDPNRLAGTYVKPEDWNALLADPSVVIVDTRNDYEVALGTFKGALNPKTKSFRDLPDWVRNEPKLRDKPRVAMFCTGGIRCEKSTAFLRAEGFSEVYHLQGGILKYLEIVPEQQSQWEGECFVFDERVSVGHGLKLGEAERCRSCQQPLTDADKAAPEYVPDASCPKCFGGKSEAKQAALRERRKQYELARRK